MKKMLSLAILGAFAVLAAPVFAADSASDKSSDKTCEAQAAKRRRGS